MIDINVIRNTPDKIKKAVADKFISADIDAILDLDKQIRALMTETETMRSKRNELSKQVSKGQGKDEAIKIVQALKTELAQKEQVLDTKKQKLDQLIATVPSIPEECVPFGKNEDDNKEVKKFFPKGKKSVPSFDFVPKDHVQICQDLNLVDTARAVKFAGSRSYILKNDGALLDLAVQRYAIDLLIKKGYSLTVPPVLVKEQA
ncbi:MAG: hypothetical protein FWD86_01330, partial [Firmicutes bacterium]|nr:hypothetical protein [Bacillota bacterium]